MSTWNIIFFKYASKRSNVPSILASVASYSKSGLNQPKDTRKMLEQDRKPKYDSLHMRICPAGFFCVYDYNVFWIQPWQNRVNELRFSFQTTVRMPMSLNSWNQNPDFTAILFNVVIKFRLLNCCSTVITIHCSIQRVIAARIFPSSRNQIVSIAI